MISDFLSKLSIIFEERSGHDYFPGEDIRPFKKKKQKDSPIANKASEFKRDRIDSNYKQKFEREKKRKEQYQKMIDYKKKLKNKGTK